jgi:hypothetical protein
LRQSRTFHTLANGPKSGVQLKAHFQVATVLDLRVPPAYGDLAVLEVRKPGFRMIQPPVASLPLMQGERAWRLGKQRGWTPGDVPGVFTGTERTIWLGFDNLDTPRGSSGGPIVVEHGLVGMVTDDQSGRALVLPINIMANFFREKGLPWGLVGSEQTSASAQPKPTSEANVNSGFRVKEVMLHAAPFDYKGDCPVKIIFAGHVSAVGGSGIVSYIIRISEWGPATLQIKGTESVQTLTFDGPGIKPVSSEWTLGGPGVKFSGWEAIEILDPNPVKSEQANFSVECTPPLPASVASVKIASASCSKIGDGAFRVEVSGDATAPFATFLGVPEQQEHVEYRLRNLERHTVGLVSLLSAVRESAAADEMDYDGGPLRPTKAGTGRGGWNLDEGIARTVYLPRSPLGFGQIP